MCQPCQTCISSQLARISRTLKIHSNLHHLGNISCRLRCVKNMQEVGHLNVGARAFLHTFGPSLIPWARRLQAPMVVPDMRPWPPWSWALSEMLCILHSLEMRLWRVDLKPSWRLRREISFIHDLSGVLAVQSAAARDQDASSSWSVGCFPEGRDVCLGASRYLSFVRQGHAQLEALPSDLPTQPCLCLIVGLSQLSFRLAPFSRILRQNLSTS